MSNITTKEVTFCVNRDCYHYEYVIRIYVESHCGELDLAKFEKKNEFKNFGNNQNVYMIVYR